MSSRGSTSSAPDRKSTRLNSSHITISYAVFCLKKKNKHAARPHVSSRAQDSDQQIHRQNRELVEQEEHEQFQGDEDAVHAGDEGEDFFFNDPATTEIYTLSLHDALPICDISVSTQPGATQFTVTLGANSTARDMS